MPANFIPIALAFVVGKLLNEIVAKKLERLLTASDIIKSSLQKGFLTNINERMEHYYIFSVCDHSECYPAWPSSIDVIPGSEERFWFCLHTSIYYLFLYM